MPFKSFDHLNVFNVVARHMSFTAAAEELHLTKGAVSYQIKTLEQDLGFDLFNRTPGKLTLTTKGQKLREYSESPFQRLQKDIALLQKQTTNQITIGMTTYFASRWLSPRLMQFTSQYPAISLRLQPTMGRVDIHQQSIDMLIRWGNGKWTDLKIERLFSAPATPTAGKVIAKKINQKGLSNILPTLPLLHDDETSSAWQEWHQAAGLEYTPQNTDLVIPDPNVRVQAVIDGQGLALNDFLINNEIKEKNLFKNF